MDLLFLSLLPLAAAQSLSDLYVDTASFSPRLYVLPHYANSHAVIIGSQLYRFAVTGPSPDYAFTLMSMNAPASGSLGVLPHIHREHYESFFNFKGRFQLWAQHGDSDQQTRLLTQGAYGDLFYYFGTIHSSKTNTLYIPKTSDEKSPSTGPTPKIMSSLQRFDVHAQLDLQSRRNPVNGSAPATED
ncbi:unnamed protein product [Penicillium nalgiovense]|nr:unnamed protein product [Penicillium nalgiovense]